jgi:hypothetical protein
LFCNVVDCQENFGARFQQGAAPDIIGEQIVEV